MNAQQLKNSILQEAIEGRLVPQDPNDEPASVLLARIRKEKERLVKEGKLKKKELEENPISEDEIPFKIPESWEWVRFFSVYNLETNLVSPNLYPNYYHVAPDNIEKGTGRLLHCNKVKDDNVKSNNHLFHKGQIVYSKIRPLLRKAIIAPFEGLCSADMYPMSSEMHLKYALLYLLSDVFNKQVSNICSSRVKMPKINQDELSTILVPLPPLAEQKRIVTKIEELLPKVEEYGKAQEALDKLNEELPERLKKSILQEAIEGRLVPQDPNDEPASVLLDKIRKEKAKLVKEGKLKKKDLEEIPITEDEIPFKIPESWEWHRIGYLANLYTGNSISKDVKESKYMNVKGRWYIGTKDVNFDNTIDYDNGVYIPEKDEPQFKIASKGSILMCIEGGSAGRKIGIIDRDACFGNKLCCFYSYGLYNLFLYYYLQSSNFKQIFNDNKKGIIGGVSINMMSPLLIPVPPLAEQQRIVAKIEQLMKEIDKLKV